MEITIKKVKLTKAVLKQMPRANFYDLTDGKPLGFFRNVLKDEDETMLIKNGDKYSLLSILPWERGEGEYKHKLYASGRWQKVFSDTNAAEDWLEKYGACVELAKTLGQIYI